MQPGPGGHADDALTVVLRPDRARNVGAVAVAVVRQSLSDAVLGRDHREVRVVEVDAGVQHRDVDVHAARTVASDGSGNLRIHTVHTGGGDPRGRDEESVGLNGGYPRVGGHRAAPCSVIRAA